MSVPRPKTPQYGKDEYEGSNHIAYIIHDSTNSSGYVVYYDFCYAQFKIFTRVNDFSFFLEMVSVPDIFSSDSTFAGTVSDTREARSLIVYEYGRNAV